MVWYKDNPQLYINELRTVANNSLYNSLHFRMNEGHVILLGNLKFQAVLNEGENSEIKDNYRILITFPDDYPNEFPEVLELDGKIPVSDDNHVNRSSEYFTTSLCLGTNIEVYKIFIRSRNIVHFIEKILIPFLYYISYKNKFGCTPYSDRSHGFLGILEYYKELFKIIDKNKIIQFLEYAHNYSNSGLKTYPWGSDKIISRSHINIIKDLSRVPGKYLNYDINALKQNK